MTKTKSELKQALSTCAKDESSCYECPYKKETNCCFVQVSRDVLEYIMELETKLREGKTV